MQRTKISDRKLPDYTQDEELYNTLTHMLGIILGIAVTILCVGKALVTHHRAGILSATIYGVSMILLYTVSTVYHGWPRCREKKILQVLDHCTIYCLIIGSFAPICLTGLRETAPAAAYGMFGLICLICSICVVFTAIDFEKYSAVSMLGYLSPWLLLFVRKELLQSYPMALLWWIVGGGAAYTIGAALYGTSKPYMHTVFHVFILLGSILQFVGIFLYCI